MSSPTPRYVNVTAANFQSDVIERSRTTPVLLDFWAAWCGPCRTLGPLLERLAAERPGRFILAKCDTEAAPEIAGAFGVQSIPTVFAVRGGEIVDMFQGLLPEPQIREWLDRWIPPTAGDSATDQPQPAESEEDAEQRLRQAIEENSSEAGPYVDLARLLLDQDRIDDSAAVIEQMAEEEILNTAGEAIRAEIELRRLAETLPAIDDARSAAAASPDDLAIQLTLARRLAVERQFEAALEAALGIVRKQQSGPGDAARKLMVDIFYLLGPNDELADRYRRQLTMLLY